MEKMAIKKTGFKPLILMGLAICWSIFPTALLSAEITYDAPKKAQLLPPESHVKAVYPRPEPDFSTKKLTAISLPQSEVEILGESKEKERFNWYRLKIDENTSGWVYGRYVHLLTEDNSLASGPDKDIELHHLTNTSVQTPLENDSNLNDQNPLPEVETLESPSRHEENTHTLLSVIVDSDGHLINEPTESGESNPLALPPSIQEAPSPPPPTGSLADPRDSTEGLIETLTEEPQSFLASATAANATVFLDLTDKPRKAQVSNRETPLKAEPGRQGPLLIMLAPGQPLTIIGAARVKDKTQPHPWYRVIIPTIGEGWVYGEHIIVAIRPSATVSASLVPAPETIQTRGYPKQGTVKVNRLRIRQGPSMTTSVLGQIPFNESVTLMGETTVNQERWYQIQYDSNQMGWMLAKHLELQENKEVTETSTSSQPLKETPQVFPEKEAAEEDKSSSEPSLSSDETEPKHPGPSKAEIASPLTGPLTGDTPLAFPSSANGYPKKATIIQGPINIRQEPSTASKILSQGQRGQSVNILNEKHTGGKYPWYQIEAPGGWVYGQFVSFTPLPALTGTGTLPQDMVESYTLPKPGSLIGSIVVLRQSHTSNAFPIAYINPHDSREIEVLAQWRGIEPYFWYQIKHATYGIGWVYGQFVSFADEASRLPQVHLLMRDLDNYYGPSVNDAMQRLGSPEKSEQRTGPLPPLSTHYVNTELQYEGLHLRFLRYFDADHLFELNIVSAQYPVGHLMIGMHKTEVILSLGEGVISKTAQGETHIYTDPVTERMKIAFHFDQEGKLTSVKKIAWIE